jgi:hypothetical protein
VIADIQKGEPEFGEALGEFYRMRLRFNGPVKDGQVIIGEACYETPARASKLRKGETLALPGGTSMRAVVTGSTARHVLAVILYDAAQPATMRMEEGTGPPLVACE